MRKKNKKALMASNKKVALGFMVFLFVALGYIGGYYIHHRNQCAEWEKEVAAFKVQQQEISNRTGVIIEPNAEMFKLAYECE